MGSDTRADHVHLFMLRVWQEPLSEGRAEIRGEVRHLTSGRQRRVRDWATLTAFMNDCINERDPSAIIPHPEETGADNTHQETK